jgi:hypothetical protein
MLPKSRLGRLVSGKPPLSPVHRSLNHVVGCLAFTLAFDTGSSDLWFAPTVQNYNQSFANATVYVRVPVYYPISVDPVLTGRF